MPDPSILWGASIQGVNNKLPTREGQLNADQVNDNLETASGLVLSRVGAVGLVPQVLVNLAAKVVEYGAAALTEQQDFPEQSTDKASLAVALWALFGKLTEQLVTGVEAVGGEPNVAERAEFNFAPPLMIQYQSF
jgi:hypothetical protein